MITFSLALAFLMQPRDTLGIYASWGAFRDASPLRCYAIAKPVGRQASKQGAFASITNWPRDGVRNQLHVRLSHPRAANARVTLAIGERRFILKAGDNDAWASDARTDSAIIAAIRAGRSMSVETISASGAAFADTYILKGAASAVDAAAIGCVGRA